MLPGMLDWMTLGNSRIAAISPSTAFGASGARGNGKVWRRICGFSEQPGNLASLKVFEHPGAGALSPQDQRDVERYLDAKKKHDARILEHKRRKRERQKE